MGDQQCYNLHPWNSFYQHYLEQHAIMTQYFQRLTQSTGATTSYNACHTCHCGCCNPMNAPYRPASQECCSSSTPDSTSSGSTTTSSSSDYELEDEEYYGADEDDAESECEYELNVDAFIAMRAAKKELDKLSENKSSESTSTSESDSIVLIDSDKEEFEFVDYGSYNTLSKLARGIDGSINKKEELETQKKIMNYLYGEKSSAIGGLETAMAVNFERLCDIHQPSLWPVLPVRL